MDDAIVVEFSQRNCPYDTYEAKIQLCCLAPRTTTISGAANLDDDAIVHRPPALSRALRVFVPGLRAHR